MGISKDLPIGRGTPLALQDLVSVARENRGVQLNKTARSAMTASEKLLDSFITKRLPVYGVTTQFGNQAHLLDPYIKSKEDTYYLASIQERQRNLVQSHDCGLGAPLAEEVSRGALLLRAHCLSQGYSGIRPAVVEGMTHLLNAGINPVIRRYGSIGASGDLVPLSALAATLIGLPRDVVYKGRVMSAPRALKAAHLKPMVLVGREGLALINGTSFSTALAGLAFADLQKLFPQMMGAIATTLEVLQVMDSGYDPIVHHVKGQLGQAEIGMWLNSFWRESKLVRHLDSSRKEILEYERETVGEDSKSMQDYYSLRSVAQGFGPFQENMVQAQKWIENEMNSVNDNPVIHVPSGKVLHGANFMGYYVTEACDMLKMDIAQASTWIHALLANLVHPRKNFGLPTNLINHPELYNGFRPLQLLAASITVQNRKLAQVQQAFMLPTEGDNQDVNSLAKHAAFDLREAVDNLERLSALLFFAAMQALDLRGVEKASSRAKAAHAKYRTRVSFMKQDRMVQKDIAETIAFLKEVSL